MNKIPMIEVFHLHAKASGDEIQICFDWIRSQLNLNQLVTIMVKRQLKQIKQLEITKNNQESPLSIRQNIFRNSSNKLLNSSSSGRSSDNDSVQPPKNDLLQFQTQLYSAKLLTDILSRTQSFYACLEFYDQMNLDDLQLLLEVLFEINNLDEQIEMIDRILKVYYQANEKIKINYQEQFKLVLREKIKRKIDQGNLDTTGNNFKDALINYKEAIDLNQGLPDDTETQFQINVHLGNTHQLLKEPDLALLAWEKSIKMMQQIIVQGSKNNHYQNELIYLHNNIGQIYYDKKQHSKAIQYWDGAISILEKQNSVSPLEMQAKQLLGHLLNNVGMIYYQKGDVKKAIANFEKTIEVYENIYSKNHISVGNRINNLGEAYRSDKQYEKALQMFKRAYEIKQKELNSKPSRSLASTLNNIGMTLQNMHVYTEAIDYFLQALKMYSEPGVYSDPNYGDGAVQRSNTMHSTAECYRAVNDLENACSHFEQSFRLKVQELKIYHKSTQHTAIQLASAYFQTNQFDMSMSIFRQVLNGQKDVYGEDSQIVAQTMNNIGTVLTELKQYDQALKYVQDAIKIFEKKLDKTDQYMIKAYENLKTIKLKLDEGQQSIIIQE